ncbi:unnamed protein product [Adineta steineri]|uniref:Protein furry n=1 Tax=Adineta steineri TaxID=433720 RepID=A0A814M2H7_9BILA|nr:unnamed protein product [Adineta steineri]CAF1072920.1 unnamed protein product [Adineta steineri]
MSDTVRRLPWGAERHIRSSFTVEPSSSLDSTIKPGEYTLHLLLNQFFIAAEARIIDVCSENKQHIPLNQCLKRGDDVHFDQLLDVFQAISENSLPSLVRISFEWFRFHINEDQLKLRGTKSTSTTTSGIRENEFLEERRQLTVHFIFCLILIDILKQLSFHPGFDVSNIEDQAFKWFRGNEKFNDITSTQPNQINYQTICDLYAEVVGVLAQSRFISVKRRFMLELNNLRKEPASPSVNANIISLNTGMRFFRVKMTPVEDFEACFQFLLDLANYFLEVRERDIKNSLANLFVEILLPVAAVVKLEMNIPIVRNFVDLLYSHVFDLCSKNKHRLAMFPLMTCLLCISQRQVFFTHWNKFMLLCLGNLRGEAKLARISLESLYRLIWVYMVRFKGENVKTTNQHLTCIVNSLFPKSFKALTPKDIPLNIFVKIIHFISQEKLDFAMKDIIFDLLSVGRCRNIMPERMNVGLRAFLVIVDSLAQNEDEPMMPLHNVTFPSGHTLRPRRTCTKMISDSIVKEIGLQSYYEPIRKTFDTILKMLDTQVGRCLLVTRPDNANKDTEDLLSGDRKPKIDLLRTCIAALPRLLPLGTPQEELIEMLARLTIHMDHELAVQAFQSLQYFVIELPEWRKSVFRGFTNFIIREVTDQLMFLSDTGKTTLDHSMRFLLQLLQQWKHVLINSTSKANNRLNISEQTDMETLAMAEGFGIIALCQTHHIRRKYGVMILREVKNIAVASKCLQPNQICLIDILDAAVPTVIKKLTPSLTLQEKANLLCNSTGDLSWLVDRSSMWDTQEEMKTIPTGSDVNVTTNVAQSTTSLSALNPNASTVSPLINTSSTSVTPTPSLAIIPQTQQTQQTQSPLSMSLPNSLIQSSNNLLLTSQIMAATNSNASTTTLASTTTQNASNNNNLSTSLTSNELNARFDMWTECLAELFVYKNILQCPLTRIEAWRMVFFRLTQLFPYVDPNNQTTEIRSSFVFRTNDIMKKANEREYNLNLWKNYLVCACCLTLSGTEKSQQFNVDTSLYQETHQDSSKFYTPASNTAVSLFRIVVNLLRCETSDIREIVIRGLGRTNPEAFKDLLEDLTVHIKDAMEVKQEKVRRMKKRDCMRLRLIRIFELLADREVFRYCYSNETEIKRSSYQVYHEYLQGGLTYLDLENEKDSDLIQQIRQYFARFVYKFINQIPHVIRETLIPAHIRYSLFELFRKWSGNLNIMTVFASTNNAREQQLKSEPCSELELIAIRACAATLCCGTIKDEWFQKTVAPWLDQFMAAHETSQLSVTTLYQLLELHGKTTNTMVVEWVIDRCYTKSVRFSDRCFTALAKIFIEVANDYPCDLPSVLTLTLTNVGSPRMHVHELALRLMVVLCKGHLSESQPTTSQQSNGISSSDDVAYIISLASNYSKSQMMLSEYLARRRPDLTMAMFSEITTRILTANSCSRGTLFMILLPWIHNIELTDPSLPKNMHGHDIALNEEQGNAFLQGLGWGSVQSTELILNNLFYLTATFASEHAPELELLWNALTGTWSHNLKVILRYMLIMITLSPCELLPYAKKIILYMCKNHEERLLNELLNELQITESLNISLERTDTLPFFRFNNSSSIFSMNNNNNSNNNNNNNSLTQLSEINNTLRKSTHSQEHKGIIHTKRHHSGEDNLQQEHVSYLNTIKNRTSSQNSLSTNFNEKLNVADMDKDHSIMLRVDEYPQAAPLPLAPYGGTAAPLKTLLPDLSIPIPCLFRCSIAIMLINELIVSGLQIDWSAHLPQLLHVAMLGMDHNRAIVYEHCKSLVFNLLLALSVQSEQIWLSELLLSHVDWDNSKLSTKIRQERDTNGIHINSQSLFTDSLNDNSISSNNDILLPETNSSTSLSREEVVQRLIIYLNTKKGCPLWAYEDITAQVHTIRSALQLTQFVQWIVSLFRICVPQAMLEERWMELALRITLSCSSRHYAGRSLQIIRALSLPLNFRWVIDILSRLVETVAEHNDDMQGYVTELLLTLTHNIDSIHKQINGLLSTSILPLSPSKDLSTNSHMVNPSILTNKIESLQNHILLPSDRRQQTRTFHRQSRDQLAIIVTNPGMATAPASPRNNNNNNTITSTLTDCISTTTICPSISTNNGFLLQPNEQQNILRFSPDSNRSCSSTTSTLTRSHSAQNVRQQHVFFPNNSLNNTISSNTNDVQTLAASIDDAKTVLAQLFWIGICLLESDYEYEFTLSIQLITTIINKIQLDTSDYIDRIMNILKAIKWQQFPGVQSLIFKGCTSTITFESTMILISCLTNILTLPFISTNKSSLAMNVIALLPYMMSNYDNQHVICIQAAESIVRVCNEHEDSTKLTNLATVMSLYAQGKFGSTASQWAKCVLKYLTDVYAQDSINWIRFLCEILDNGPNYLQISILDIFYHLVTLIDTKSLNDYASFNNELVRTLCKYVNKTEYCNEVTKTLKLLIQRSSTLSTPKHITTNSHYNNAPLTSLMGEVHFFDTHKSSIELPGRTLDIEYNLSHIMNAIKSKDQQNHSALKFLPTATTMNSRRRHTCLGTTIATSDLDMTSWKHNAAQSQIKTRERLTALMFACGKQAGLSRLPLNRSASVVFSQTSDLAEQPPMGSLPSSSKESMTSENVDQTFISKQFDFLNDEDSIHEMFPITTDTQDFGDEDDGPMPYDDPPIPADHEPRRNSVSNTLRNLSSVGEWFDTNRLKSKIRGKLPSFNSSSGSRISGRKQSASEFTHTTDVVVDASRHMHEFTSAMDASTTTNMISTTGRERTGASINSEDMPDLSISHNHHPTGLLHVVTMNNEYIEDAWQTHARNLIDEINPSDSVKTFLLFRRLFKEIRRRLSIFVHETCHCLSMDNRFRQMVTQLVHMLNVLMESLDCTLVFVDENIMNITQLLIKHRLIITELNEIYANYKSKKALAIDCLDSIKANLKLQSLGERGYDTFVSNEQKIHMCKHLYTESYSKLVSNLLSFARDPLMNIRNLSSEFTIAFNGLNDFLNDIRSGKEDQPTIETNNLPNRDTAIAYIFQCLQKNTYSNAIKYLRSARSLWPDDFGDENNEIDVALTILYESLKKTLTTANLLVVLQQTPPIADVCHRLYELNLKILSSTPDSL